MGAYWTSQTAHEVIVLQAIHQPFGVASNATYWSTARSGGADGLGVASNATYWSTARSGGADGLGIVSRRPEANHSLSGLGIVPNDFELARQYGWYTPVQHGWINGQKRWWPGGNLGAPAAAAMLSTNGGDTDTKNMIKELVRAEQIKAVMAIVSGAATVITASIIVARAIKGRKGRE